MVKEVGVASRVYIHIGLPKTGTTYLQGALWQSRDELARRGVLVPGESQMVQRFAFWDLVGRRLRGADQSHVPGAWRRLARTVRAWDGDQVVLSDEFLVHARPAQVRRMVRAFAPAEVHVVVTVRDLERVICSAWQEEVAKTHAWPWSDFLAAVTDPDAGPATAALGFWLRQDLQRVLGVWESGVAPEHIHVAVVPPPGSSPTRLLELFAEAAGLDAAALTPPPPKKANTSVGVAEAEVLRRVNAGLHGRLDERQHLHVLRGVARRSLRARSQTACVSIPPEQRAWVVERSRQTVEVLKNHRYDVVGDLDDLLPAAATTGDTSRREVTADDVADAAVAALTAVLEDYARLWTRVRRKEAASTAGRATRLASSTRAVAFTTRLRLLELADRNPVVARAARLYLRRTSRRRPAGGQAKARPVKRS